MSNQYQPNTLTLLKMMATTINILNDRTMKTISEIEAKLKELDLLYNETRKGKKTSELTKDEREKILAISEQGEDVSEERYEMFLTMGRIILYGTTTSVFVLNDGKEKFMAVLNDEFKMITSYRRITDEQYNAFV